MDLLQVCEQYEGKMLNNDENLKTVEVIDLEEEYEGKKALSTQFREANYTIQKKHMELEELDDENYEDELPERRTLRNTKGRYLTRSKSRKSRTDAKSVVSNKKISQNKKSTGTKKRRIRRRSVKRTRSENRIINPSKRLGKKKAKKKKVNTRKQGRRRTKGTKDYNHEDQNKKIKKIKKKAVYESDIDKALALLQENAIPEEILCRENEKETMKNFIAEGIKEEGCSQCLCKDQKKIIFE